MKKVLYGTTALVAVGLMAGQASASEPIKLGLGGFMNQWVGWANNERIRPYEASVVNAVSNPGGTGRKYNTWDVQSDSEVYVKGSTKLDNGISISAEFQIEGDTNNGTSGQAIDESFITVKSDMLGTLLLGGKDDAGYLIAITAPDVGLGIGGNRDAKFGGATNAYWQRWVPAPSNFTMATNSFFDPGDDAAKATYISPSFYGFAVGGSWTPDNSSQVNNIGNGIANKAAGASQSLSGGGAYSNKFGDLEVGVEAAYGTIGANFAGHRINAWQTGAKLGYAGFTLSGGYADYHAMHSSSLIQNNTVTNLINGGVFEAGLAYKTGPYGVSLSGLRSAMDGAVTSGPNGNLNNTGKDVATVIMLSGSYDLGPGVTLRGSAFRVNYDPEMRDRATVSINTNSGWGVVTGLCLTF